jgi:hypothetical protein
MKGYGVEYIGNDHSSRIGKFEGGVGFVSNIVTLLNQVLID